MNIGIENQPGNSNFPIAGSLYEYNNKNSDGNNVSSSLEDCNYVGEKKKLKNTDNIPGLVIVGILFILSLIIFIFEILYFTKFNAHSLSCGFHIIKSKMNVVDNARNLNEKHVLMNNGIMANIFADKGTFPNQETYVENTLKKYEENELFYNENCKKMVQSFKSINKIRSAMENDIDNYSPNDVVLYSWMAPHGSFAYKTTYVLTFITFSLTLLLAFGFILKFLLISKNNQLAGIIFTGFSGLTALSVLFRLFFTLGIYISYDGLKHFFIQADFIITSIIFLLFILIIVLLLKKKM